MLQGFKKYYEAFKNQIAVPIEDFGKPFTSVDSSTNNVTIKSNKKYWIATIIIVGIVLFIIKKLK